MDWEKINTENQKKTVKIKLRHVKKKPVARKQIVVKTPFSHSTLNLEQKLLTPQNHSILCSTSCLGVTKIRTPV